MYKNMVATNEWNYPPNLKKLNLTELVNNFVEAVNKKNLSYFENIVKEFVQRCEQQYDVDEEAVPNEFQTSLKSFLENENFQQIYYLWQLCDVGRIYSNSSYYHKFGIDLKKEYIDKQYHNKNIPLIHTLDITGLLSRNKAIVTQNPTGKPAKLERPVPYLPHQTATMHPEFYKKDENLTYFSTGTPPQRGYFDSFFTFFYPQVPKTPTFMSEM